MRICDEERLKLSINTKEKFYVPTFYGYRHRRYAEKAEEYGYKLISMPYVLKGKDIYPYVDFEEFDQKVFYDTLRSGEIPKTFALSPENISNILNLLLRKVKTFCTCIFGSNERNF